MLLFIFLSRKEICGPYPIHEPARLTINRKKGVDFQALKNLSPVRNGCIWSFHLLFIFTYYRENQVRTKNPSLTLVRKKRSTKTRFLGLGIKLPIGKVPHMRKHPSRPRTWSLLVNWVCGSIWVKDQITYNLDHTHLNGI